jgi:hypothetical protein
MTTLTLRRIKDDFIVTGPDIEPSRFKSRREAKDWCATKYAGSPIKEIAADTSASAECRHWSGRAVRWSSCAILLSCDAHRRRLWASSASASAMSATRPVSPDHDPWNTSRGRALSPSEGVPSPSPRQPQGHPRDDKQESRMVSERPPGLAPPVRRPGGTLPRRQAPA